MKFNQKFPYRRRKKSLYLQNNFQFENESFSFLFVFFPSTPHHVKEFIVYVVQKSERKEKKNYHYLFLIKQGEGKRAKKKLLCVFEAVTLLPIIHQNDFIFCASS
jgi:hypothetical protein